MEEEAASPAAEASFARYSILGVPPPSRSGRRGRMRRRGAGCFPPVGGGPAFLHDPIETSGGQSASGTRIEAGAPGLQKRSAEPLRSARQPVHITPDGRPLPKPLYSRRYPRQSKDRPLAGSGSRGVFTQGRAVVREEPLSRRGETRKRGTEARRREEASRRLKERTGEGSDRIPNDRRETRGRREENYAWTASGCSAYGSSNQKRVPRPLVLST